MRSAWLLAKPLKTSGGSQTISPGGSKESLEQIQMRDDLCLLVLNPCRSLASDDVKTKHDLDGKRKKLS